MLENLLAGVSAGAITGEAFGSDVEALRKALTAGYGTDSASLTGGAALRVQSLDATMKATIQENQHFRLFNKLAKPNADATVDEWTEQSAVGGFLGGSTNTETGIISAATGTYARRVGLVEYLSTLRSVSFVQTLQKAIADAEAAEYNNGAMQLLGDAEYLCFEGDSTVVPTEFDGINAQIVSGVTAGQVDPNNVLDARGAALSSINLLNTGAAQIAKFGNFGRPTDIFMCNAVQADFDTGLDPAFRVPLADVPEGGTKLGAPVVGIRTSWGNIATNSDVFVRDETMKMPFDVMQPAVATAQASIAPASVVAGSPASNTASQFVTAQAGTYYYAVAGVNAAGQSTIVKSGQVAIAAGQQVAITITRSAGAQETGYVIYRSRQNQGNVTSGLVGVISDFREVTRIPVGGATTIWTDTNADIPGTTRAFILNMTRGADAITWRQLLPMMKFPLYPTNQAVVPWAQLLFGYLRLAKRKHHVVIKNIVPNSAVWRPFA